MNHRHVKSDAEIARARAREATMDLYRSYRRSGGSLSWGEWAEREGHPLAIPRLHRRDRRALARMAKQYLA